MQSIEIKNLRSLKDTGKVELKPITLLVGANSSGKSTFLRTFPLLKQGLKVKTQGPILWYGPEVDFGNFATCLRDGTNAMEFSFHWEQIVYTSIFSRVDSLCMHDVDYTIVLEPFEDDAFIKESIIRIGDNRIEFSYANGNSRPTIYVNGVESTQYTMINLNSMSYGSKYVPIIYSHVAESEKAGDYNSSTSLLMRCLLKMQSLQDKLGNLQNGFSESIELGSRKQIAENLLKLLQVDVPVETIIQDPAYEHFVNVLLIVQMVEITESVDSAFCTDLENVHYIKPFRATAERYYRQQNLAVNNLESDGHNMAMYVSNMYKSQRIKKSFQEWTNRAFGFVLESHTLAGHVSLEIKDGRNEKSWNLTDKGFGYSQILPVILKVWQFISDMMEQRHQKKKDIIIAIEQPELHLHPKLQSLLMNMFIDVAKDALESNVSIHFIIETHSQTMINKLGVRIARGEYNPEDAIVLLFCENTSFDQPNPQRAGYSKEGFLMNWPVDFFDVEE